MKGNKYLMMQTVYIYNYSSHKYEHWNIILLKFYTVYSNVNVALVLYNIDWVCYMHYLMKKNLFQ